MTVHPPPVPRFPPPSDEQAAALRTASEYLKLAGTQAATFVLGCPPLNGDTAMLAEFSNAMLSGAALCMGLLELADEQGNP